MTTRRPVWRLTSCFFHDDVVEDYSQPSREHWWDVAKRGQIKEDVSDGAEYNGLTFGWQLQIKAGDPGKAGTTLILDFCPWLYMAQALTGSLSSFGPIH